MDIEQNYLVAYCLEKAGMNPIEMLQALGDAHYADIEYVLVGLLQTEAQAGRVDAQATEIKGLRNFGSQIRRRSNGNTEVVYSFAIGDAAVECALPLMGLLASLLAGTPSWSDIAGAGGVLKIVWEKFKTLRHPQDSEAIAVLDALLRLAVRSRLLGKRYSPTAEEIAQEASRPLVEATALLSRLDRMSIVKVVEWGGQRDDVSAGANRWAVRV